MTKFYKYCRCGSHWFNLEEYRNHLPVCGKESQAKANESLSKPPRLPGDIERAPADKKHVVDQNAVSLANRLFGVRSGTAQHSDSKKQEDTDFSGSRDAPKTTTDNSNNDRKDVKNSGPKSTTKKPGRGRPRKEKIS